MGSCSASRAPTTNLLGFLFYIDWSSCVENKMADEKLYRAKYLLKIRFPDFLMPDFYTEIRLILRSVSNLQTIQRCWGF